MNYQSRAYVLALRALELGHALRAVLLWEAAGMSGQPLTFE